MDCIRVVGRIAREDGCQHVEESGINNSLILLFY